MGDIRFFDQRLEKEKTYWLSSLGTVTLDEGLPIMEGSFFELKDDISIKEFSPLGGHFKPKKEIEIPIDIGTLVYLSVGCLIHKNKIILPKKDMKLKVSGLGIIKGEDFPYFKRRDFYNFRFGEKVWKNTSYPDFRFFFGKHTKQKCLSFISDGYVNIIPCAEVLRFYYGVSSTLLEHLLKEGIENDTIVRREKTTRFRDAKNDGTDQIRLTKFMLNVDVKHIARLLLTEEGYRAAKAIGWSIREDSSSKYPTALFPFNDLTELEISSIDLGSYPPESGFNGQKGRFITRIHSCNKSFAENGVLFSRDNDSRQTDDSDIEEIDNPRLSDDELVVEAKVMNNESKKPNGPKKVHIVDTSRFISEPKDSKFKQLVKEKQKTKNTGKKIINDDADYDTFSKVIFDESNAGALTLLDSRSHFKKKTVPRRKNIEYLDFYNSIINHFSNDKNYNVERIEIAFQPKEVRKAFDDDKAVNFASGKKKSRGEYEGERKVLLNCISNSTSSHFFYLLDIVPRENHTETFGSIYFIYNDGMTTITNSKFYELFLIMARLKTVSLVNKQCKEDEIAEDFFQIINKQPFDHQFILTSEHTFTRIKEHYNSLLKAKL